jgi:uncharacterized protein (TIGR02145 family)
MEKTHRISFYTWILFGIVSIIFNGCKKDDDNPSSGTVSDIDGNVYHTVVIGTQTWMVENLKVTKYKDGSPITPVTDNTTWVGLTTEAYCWYNNDAVTNKNTYGALYNWYSVNTGKLAPVGWHVPSQAEWETLISYLGGDSVAGGKVKASGTDLWLTPNTGATNSSGFTAVPAGSHYTNGAYYLMGKYGWYWSITESSADEAWHVYVQYNSEAITGKAGSKKDGFSVRCIKD